MTDRSALSAADLIALVGSRIAHDLNNPIGAIANGVELIGLTTDMGDSPEFALITESVENARRRIKAFRIAFGAARPGQVVSAAEIAEVTAPGADGRRVAIDWAPGGDVPRPEAKRVMLALMCVESALPWGGQVAVRTSADGWQIAASAERMKVDPALWAVLDGAAAPDELTANEVHFALLAVEAARVGRRVATELGETTIRIVV